MGTASLTYEKKMDAREGKGVPSPKRPEKKVSVGALERRRMLQLLVCIFLFLAVFIGRGILPEQMAHMTPTLSRLLSSEVTLSEVTEVIIKPFTQGVSVTATLEELMQQVFFGESDVTQGVASPHANQQAIQRLMEVNIHGNLVAQQLGLALPSYPQGTLEDNVAEELLVAEEDEVAETERVEEKEEVAIITPVYYDGIPLPDNVTLDYYNLEALGIGAMITPVSGELSSEFGWRIHPIYDEIAFHYGTDISVAMGEPIGAFASGVVDYIGENDDYGLYLQIIHEGGVTSFYAHCSELLVQAGQEVKVGEVVALAGSTGVSTGPHLHLELKVDGVYINSGYYLEYADYA